ncbi:MAG: glutamine-hydrolyzing carbamoyl-phosphate synthase small subunit [Candidatus Neomarinimicrobiota bacterium]
MTGNKPAILVLEDGRTFRGWSFGAQGETSGEVCFNTGMTGYQEILTDPSYTGQIVTMTYPHIGNYGVNDRDVESSRIHVEGFVVREETVTPSNFRATQSIGDYLRAAGIVGIQGVDTRALTRHIRSQGAMNGIISTVDLEESSLLAKLKKVPHMVGLDLVSKVTCEESHTWKGDSSGANGGPHVAAIDYGIKWNILRLLSSHDCRVTVFPGNSGPDDIMAIDPDGILLSNGPGDPAAVSYATNTVKELLGKTPLFGVCLGHQILALALGAKTYKLKFGHHGTNHPVRNVPRKNIEITSQNHGFSVDPDSLPSQVDITHWNLNDNTVEGLGCRDFPAFSVQYHPEAGPGPHDSRYLFREFIDSMRTRQS